MKERSIVELNFRFSTELVASFSEIKFPPNFRLYEVKPRDIEFSEATFLVPWNSTIGEKYTKGDSDVKPNH